MSDLRAVLVIDYQNVHLTGAGLFEPHQPPHEHLVHPLHYAKLRLVRASWSSLAAILASSKNSSKKSPMR